MDFSLSIDDDQVVDLAEVMLLLAL